MTDHAQKKFQNLELALTGNCRVAALVECHSRIVRWCFPRFDSDSSFSRLLAGEEEKGLWEAAFVDLVDSHVNCLRDTAVVETTLTHAHGVTDFAPRFDRNELTFWLPQIMGLIEPLHGLPHIAIKVRPTCNCGLPVDEFLVG
jgi:hypothetical protein